MNLVQTLRARRRQPETRHTVSTIDDYFTFLGHQYPMGAPNLTMSGSPQEDIPNSFTGYSAAFKSNSIVFGLILARMQVFSQIRFAWRRYSDGSLFGSRELRALERPWPGGTSLDLLAKLLLSADIGGNGYVVRSDGRMKVLRPDWMSIVLGSQSSPDDPAGMVDTTVVGYLYKPGGKTSKKPAQPLGVSEVAHFAPMPDPEAEFRGMSWITPVLRELKADNAATDHKLKFFENAATPNLAVSTDASLSQEDFNDFVDKMDAQHQGTRNAYKTLYLAGGADATVVGANMQQLDFKVTQGAGETRMALAAGVHPVVAGLSEGMQGSSLNAGNYQAAKRSFSDKTLQHLWRNAVASLEPLVPRPGEDAELWFSTSDVPFLQDDLKDTAEIQSKQSQAIRALTESGYEPRSVIAAVTADDYTLLKHTGVFSVQLQPPGSENDADGPAGSGASSLDEQETDT